MKSLGWAETFNTLYHVNSDFISQNCSFVLRNSDKNCETESLKYLFLFFIHKFPYKHLSLNSSKQTWNYIIISIINIKNALTLNIKIQIFKNSTIKSHRLEWTDLPVAPLEIKHSAITKTASIPLHTLSRSHSVSFSLVLTSVMLL